MVTIHERTSMTYSAPITCAGQGHVWSHGSYMQYCAYTRGCNLCPIIALSYELNNHGKITILILFHFICAYIIHSTPRKEIEQNLEFFTIIMGITFLLLVFNLPHLVDRFIILCSTWVQIIINLRNVIMVLWLYQWSDLQKKALDKI